MYVSAPELTVADAARLIRNRESLRGSVVDFVALARILAAERPPAAGWHLENGVLALTRSVRIDLPTSISFFRCTFLLRPGYRLFEYAHFDGRVRLINCAFDGDCRLHHCRFEERLVFDSVECAGELEVTDCVFGDPPDCERVRFGGRVTFSGMGGAWATRRAWRFSRCEFYSRVELEVPDAATELHFNGCSFLDGCTATVKLPGSEQDPGHLACQFEECLIRGRISVEPNRVPGRDFAPPPPAHVSLVGSVVSGEVDFSRLALDTLDLARVTISGGQLGLDRHQLYHRLPWRQWLQIWRWHHADRRGILQREQQVGYDSSVDEAVREQNYADDMEAIAREYGELRNSFAHVPNAAWQEDYCHYKLKDHQRRARIARIGPECIIATTGLLASCLLIASVPVWLGLGLVGPAVFLATACIAVLLLARHHVIPACGAFFDWLFLKWALGYGVYLHRIVITASVVPILFAVLFGIVTAMRPELGQVAGEHGVTILEEPSDIPNRDHVAEAGRLRLLGCGRRLLYFSVTTFTTLGYGDYHPTRWLQLASILEACLGATLIAVVTVSLARKFLR